ncbi:MAG TPA: hypothetical protein VLF69_02485 [Candidatus Saccharimonadales bacterium]|nr:hypothetical protein [Candidatus Saccharimonadales bacterium]
METDSAVQTIASFTGTLLKRERAAGQKFVQLVFREDSENWLCISNNLADAALAVGQLYRIEGIFRKVGGRAFIQSPKITPFRKRRIKLKRIGISAAVVLVIAALTAVSVRAVNGSLTPTSADTGTTQHTTAQAPDTANAAATVQTPAPTDTTTTTSPTPTPTPPKPKPHTAGTTAAVVQTQTSTTPAVTTPDCDPIVVTPFGTQTVEDDSQPVGSSTITQTGVDGQSQTCYPDGRSAAGVTTVLATEQDQITTVGPAAPPPGP